MPKIPDDLEKWHSSCLARYILKQSWHQTGIVESAMIVMEANHIACSIAVLCQYFFNPVYAHRVHPDTPPEILAELKRRAGL